VKRSSILTTVYLAVLLAAPAAPAHAQSPARPPGDSATAHPVLRLDSSALRPRTPAASEVEKYRSDDAFDYREKPRPRRVESFIERIIAWIIELFGRAASNSVTGRYLPLALFLGILGYILWMLMGRGRTPLFASSDRNLLDPSLVEENIHEMDFDRLIQAALDQKRYNVAVRLSYLRLLKQMSAAGLIAWRIDKTNRDYLDELARTELRGPFAQVTRLYEFVWYGDFAVDAPAFERIRSAFADVGRLVEEKR
jgi:hypothetical protein